jgi:hypothetical protein
MYDLLRGLRVVEASAFVAAPSCALHLAQFGAEVVRIDQIGGGPDFRRWPLDPRGGASFYWEGLNKGKRSVALDLTRPEGRELAVRIVTASGENAGLFVTNYPVDGYLSYEALRSLRHDLICVRIMGWPDGRPAVDYTINAAVGVPAMRGPVTDTRPVNHTLPAWDLLAGAYAAFTLVAAERARRQDGRGQEIRIPLSDLAIASLGHLVLAAREYLRRAQQATFEAVSRGGKVDAVRIESEQRRLHGLAWIATAVEGMEALLAWASRIAPRGETDAGAALVVRIGFGEYLAQILGGLPMSQNELVRPGDLDAQDAAGLLRADPAVSDLAEMAELGVFGVCIAPEYGLHRIGSLRGESADQDHLDLATLRRLHVRHNPLIVTPLGNDVILRRAIPGVRVRSPASPG